MEMMIYMERVDHYWQTVGLQKTESDVSDREESDDTDR